MLVNNWSILTSKKLLCRYKENWYCDSLYILQYRRWNESPNTDNWRVLTLKYNLLLLFAATANICWCHWIERHVRVQKCTQHFTEMFNYFCVRHAKHFQFHIHHTKMSTFWRFSWAFIAKMFICWLNFTISANVQHFHWNMFWLHINFFVSSILIRFSILFNEIFIIWSHKYKPHIRIFIYLCFFSFTFSLWCLLCGFIACVFIWWHVVVRTTQVSSSYFVSFDLKQQFSHTEYILQKSMSLLLIFTLSMNILFDVMHVLHFSWIHFCSIVHWNIIFFALYLFIGFYLTL